MKYNMTGASLPMLYATQQDPTFHIDESWELAEGEINGDKFRVILYTCGEVSIHENNEWVDVKDVIEKYDTDEKLHKALDAGILDFQLNNWYEPQVFYENETGGAEYLELTPDLVVFSFDEAIETTKEMLDDENFAKDLAKEIAQIKSLTAKKGEK